MVRLHESNERLQSQLRTFDEALVVGLDRIRSGGRLHRMVRLFPTVSARTATEDAIIGHFEARRLLRRSVIHALLSDGMEVQEISQLFNVPVGVVSAFAAEKPSWDDPS